MSKQIIRKIFCFALTMALLFPCTATKSSAIDISDSCQSAILMEATTGQVLYELNADEQLPPASVTKIMTILLVMEAVDSGQIALTDPVTVSDYASTMGGSQVFLKAGEVMCVEDLLKSVVVASANDAAVALAEHICGSEEDFVARMNQRARELGMVNTHFENTNGLDDTTENHVTSARDIAIMSAELMRHPTVLNYTTIWMDTIRGGEFTLTNTNRLIRFYNGANGLKTGSTSRAKFCISATAKRNDLQLIAVIMASPTRDIRNESAKKLLDYGFANYSYIFRDGGSIDSIPIVGGKEDFISAEYGSFGCVTNKANDQEITTETLLPESLSAPIRQGDCIGKITYFRNGELLGEVEITASNSVERIDFFSLFGRLFVNFLTI